MARMLGENVLPEAVQSRRRMLRSRLQDLREPIRRQREDKVPGPDVVGSAESRIASLRDRLVGRDSVTDVLPTRGSDSSSGSSDSSNDTSNNTSRSTLS